MAHDPTCNHSELLAAARAVAMYLRLSTDVGTNDAMYRSPSSGLREAADALDRKDAALRRFRAALDACKDLKPEAAR